MSFVRRDLTIIKRKKFILFFLYTRFVVIFPPFEKKKTREKNNGNK